MLDLESQCVRILSRIPRSEAPGYFPGIILDGIVLVSKTIRFLYACASARLSRGIVLYMRLLMCHRMTRQII